MLKFMQERLKNSAEFLKFQRISYTNAPYFVQKMRRDGPDDMTPQPELIKRKIKRTIPRLKTIKQSLFIIPQHVKGNSL